MEFARNFNPREKILYTNQQHNWSPDINRDHCGWNNAASVTVDPSGKFAYATNARSNDVSTYTISTANGILTSIGTIAAESGYLTPLRRDPFLRGAISLGEPPGVQWRSRRGKRHFDTFVVTAMMRSIMSAMSIETTF